MKWALVSQEQQMHSYWKYDSEQQTQVWTTEEIPANTIINLIEYDGQAAYAPPENTVLMEVADELYVGDLAN